MKCAKFYILVLVITIFLVPIRDAQATLTSCSASASPGNVSNGSTTDFSFSITNESPTDGASWMQVETPGGEITLNSFNASDWSPEIAGEGSIVVFSGGSLGPTETYSFSINATANGALDAANWGIIISDTGSADGGINCSGSLGVTVGEAGESSPISISGIGVSGSASSATITWNTDVPGTSVVDFGTSDSYGQTESNSNLATSHSITLSGLSSSTTYHYRVKSLDAGNNEAQSGDNTFTTSESGSIESSTTSTSSKISPTPTLPPDIDPPTLYIATDLSRPVAKAPFIRGTATDDRNISLIEYSIDGGRNWSSANYTKSTSAKSLSFSFTPVIKDDGNYDIVTRAKDSAGNIGNSKKYVLVFDRIPPKIGGSIITSGPQIQRVSSSGVIALSSKIAYKMFFTSIGGATDINLIATPSAGGDPLIIKSQKNDYTNVWGAEMNFAEPGTYMVSAEAIDGADNKTITRFPEMQILEGGSVHSDSGEVISKGKVSVYYMDPETNMFHLWDAGSYGQINPSITDEKGRYSFNLPKGQYYIGIESDGFVDSVTDIFSLSESTLINSDFIMRKKKSFSFLFVHLNIPSFSADKTTLNLKNQSIQSKPAQVIGKKLPQVNLMSGGEKITQEFFKNKNTIIGFTNTWLPETQVLIDNLNTQNDEQAIIVIPHESDSYIQTFQKRGDYKIKFASDPDGVLLNYFGISMLPSIVEIDENGIVKNLKIGVSSKEDN